MSRMSVWAAGPFLAACMLLAWSGWAKLRNPESARAAARAIGAPASRSAVRGLGALELLAALLGVVLGGWAALLVAVVFAGLAVVASLLVRRAPATPCGCLGGSDAPASRAHVAVNVGAAIVAFLAAFRSSGASVLDVIGTQPLAGVPFVMLALCAARLAALTMDQLPALARAAAKGGRR